MDKLYAKLNEQHSLMQQPREVTKTTKDEGPYVRGFTYQSSDNSLPLTPATETFPGPLAAATRSASVAPTEGQATSEELLRLKLELARAQNRISRMDQELQTRVKSDHDSAIPQLVSDSDNMSIVGLSSSPAASRIGPGTLALNAPGKVPAFSREHSWATQDDALSDMADTLPAANPNRLRGIWNNNNFRPAFGSPFSPGQMIMDGSQPAAWPSNRVTNYEPTFAAPTMDIYRQNRMGPEQDAVRPMMGRRGNRYDNRYGPPSNYGGGCGGYGVGPAPYEIAHGYSAGPPAMMGNGLGMGLYSPYQQQPVGSALSPHATEFTTASWKGEVS